MTRLSWVVVAVFVLALAAMSVLYAQARVLQGPAEQGTPGAAQIAQAARGGASGRAEFSEADRAKMREQMMDRMLAQAGLTEKERAAAKKAMKAKDGARGVLWAQFTELRRTANKPDATSTELQDAAGAYRTALAQYRKKVSDEDQALASQLPLRGQARCLSLGVLDNGLPGMSIMRSMRWPGAGPGLPRE